MPVTATNLRQVVRAMLNLGSRRALLDALDCDAYSLLPKQAMKNFDAYDLRESKRATQLDVSFWIGRLLQVANAIESVKDAAVLPDAVRSELRGCSYAINRALTILENERRYAEVAKAVTAPLDARVRALVAVVRAQEEKA